MRVVKRWGRRAMERTGLIGPYYRWVEKRLAHRPGVPMDDGLPMPPPELLMAVAGTAGEAWFSERGKADAEKFERLAGEHGAPIGAGARVLDFGCGCGRISRWLAPRVEAAGGAFFGSDINARLVAWCAANLPGEYQVNGLRPPLRLPQEGLDLIYAHSVLTHLTEDGTRAWLAELAGKLRPGGLALLTFHDEDYAQAWAPPEVRSRFGARPYLVRNNALEGSNYLSAWTTRDYMAALAGRAFEVVDMLPGGRDLPEQAIAVLRRRVAS